MARVSNYNAAFYFGASPAIFELANTLRKNLTDAEKILWANLRNRKIKGYKFRRQHPIGKYVVDFYCHEKLLIIELDGGIHENPEVKKKDDGREFDLKNLGLTIIRIKNEEVESDLQNVLNKINKHL